MALISLITDFGTQDWFVGTMKGVIARLAPKAQVVDVTHHIPPGEVSAGAFALACAFAYFPPKTVHLAVVDPGVGSDRPALAVQTSDYLFVGPDNGLLSLALARQRVRSIHRLENPRYFLDRVSHTFHGRDIFAPVAAHLSRGLPCHRLGPPARDYTRLNWPTPARSRQAIRGEVIHVDRFGNALTNIPAHWLAELAGIVRVRGKKTVSVPIAGCYQAVPPGQPVAVPGSSGFLEIAVASGHAARQLNLRVGSTLSVAGPCCGTSGQRS